jgi:2-methylcitrate dehydratase PrpD
MIDVTLRIVSENDLDPEDINVIEVLTFESAYKLSKPINRKTLPENVVDAQFSPQYGIAVAVTDREVVIDQYSQERIKDPELQTLMQKISVHEKKEMSNIFPKEWPTSVTIKTDSETYRKSTKFPIGELENPLRKSQIIEKFDSLTSPGLTPKHQRKLTEIILDLENVHVKDVSRIMQEI